MIRSEAVKVEAHLRKTFGNNGIEVDMPKKAGQPGEVRVGSEFIGTLYRDDDEGEVSYSFTMSILEKDLQPNL